MAPHKWFSIPWLCIALAYLLPGSFTSKGQMEGPQKTPADWVNPLIGTAKGGNVFPGAVYPFGMMQWSPDDSPKPGGYEYSSKRITGFGLTHFSGRGHYGWGDFPFLPVVGPVNDSPSSTWDSYAVTFSHDHEQTGAGCYSVLLDNGITVELTATLHGGVGRFSLPAASPTGTILINAGGSRNGDKADSKIEIVDSQTVTGIASSHITNVEYKLYFAARFDRAFQSGGTWNGPTLTHGPGASQGPNTGAFLTFANNLKQPLQVKVGISFVSTANALNNLSAEIGDKDFVQVKAEAAAAWTSALGKIQIADDNANQKIIFYTNLYHSLIHPNVFSDVNGQYLGFDGTIHQLGPGEAQYENITTWDGWRNQFPLLCLIAPRQARDIIQSLLRDAQQDAGGGMPRWEQANQNSGGMLGDSPAILVSEAYTYGIRDFDVNAAFNILQKAATDPKVASGGHPVRESLAEYRSRKYVPANSSPFSASMTLEYCNDDFALSRLALALGQADRAAYYEKEAQNWKNLYSSTAGYIVPKEGNGAFSDNYKLGTDEGFKEGTAQQYTWLVPFNFQGLFNLMGGKQAAIGKLNQLFGRLNEHLGSHAYMGNEPGATSPWAYDFAGAPYLTQKTTRDVVLSLYQNTPGGLPGNDDGGAMGSWYVFASLGLFPEIPGVPGFVVGSPLFKQATMALPTGSMLKIHAPAASDQACYVRSLSINQKDYSSPWIPWDMIKNGADLDFVMQSAPDVDWGSDPTKSPPSFDTK